jgi:hypothetical protein
MTTIFLYPVSFIFLMLYIFRYTIAVYAFSNFSGSLCLRNTDLEEALYSCILVNRLPEGRPSNCSLPGTGSRFVSFPNPADQLCSQPSLLINGCRSILYRVQNDRDVTLNTPI